MAIPTGQDFGMSKQSYFCTMTGAPACRIEADSARRAAERYAWAFHLKQQYAGFGGIWPYLLRVDETEYKVEFSTTVFVKVEAFQI